jgi:hypothetical protein
MRRLGVVQPCLIWLVVNGCFDECSLKSPTAGVGPGTSGRRCIGRRPFLIPPNATVASGRYLLPLAATKFCPEVSRHPGRARRREAQT